MGDEIREPSLHQIGFHAPTSVDQLSWTASIAADRKRMALYWAPLLACMAAIFVASSLSGSTVSGPVTATPGPSPSYKLAIAHVVEYAVLSALAFRLFASYDVRPGVRLWGATLLLAIVYAATDELHQAFVPGRVPAWVDIGYDSAGALIGLMAAELLVRLRAAVAGAG